jgi:hypothetical protein
MNGTATLAYRSPEQDLSLRALNRAGRRTYLALFFSEYLLGQKRFSRLLGETRERNRRRMLEHVASLPKHRKMPVREISFTSHADFYRNHPDWEPAVFRGAAKDWPAIKKWDLDFFARNYTDTKAVSIDQRGLYGEGETGRSEIVTLGKIIAAIRAGERRCLRFAPVIDENPELRNDLDMQWLDGFPSRFSVRRFNQFFLAPASVYTPIHCAMESNAFIQIYGKKRWILYPAVFQPLIEPPADGQPFFHSGFMPDGESAEYPLGAHAPAYEVVLDEGDVMYIPPFVWHYVENLSTSIAVAYRFYSIRAALRSSWPLTVTRLSLTKPSVFHSLVCPRRSLKRHCTHPRCPFALPAAKAAEAGA